MKALLRKIGESIATHGWGNGLLFSLARALQRSTRGRCRLLKYYFVAQPVPERPLRPLPRTTRTRIFQAFADDAVVAEFPRPSEVIARRFRDGAVCLVAQSGDAFAGFIWLKLERYDEDEVRCEYVLDAAAGVAWDFDAYVSPEFRMSRVFVQLWEAANDFLRQRGYRWSASRISAFNVASIASHRRLDAVHLHTGVFLLVGPTQWSFFSCPPYVHVALRRASRPSLAFGAPAAARSR